MSGLRRRAAAVILAEMQRQGVSRSELARRCGVDQAAVSRALSGRQNLTLDSLEQYGRALSATIDVVVEGQDKQQQRQAQGENPWL